MKLRRLVLTHRQLMVAEGERMPPWYYGAGYHDFATRTTAFYPMPVNYVVRLKFWVEWTWHRKRSTCGVWLPASEIGPTVEDAYQRGRRHGEEIGRQHGYDEAIKRMKHLAGIDDD